jgi:protein involved in sex pheromone biosynthesis
MKKSLGILATLALTLSPVAAFANPQVQGNVQAGSNEALTQGYGNVTDQTVSNDLYQTQLDLDGYGLDPQIQNSVQAGQNTGITQGYGNVTDQDVYNSADQWQSDIDFPGY